jgi:hypothetical protein
MADPISNLHQAMDHAEKVVRNETSTSIVRIVRAGKSLQDPKDKTGNQIRSLFLT